MNAKYSNNLYKYLSLLYPNCVKSCLCYFVPRQLFGRKLEYQIIKWLSCLFWGLLLWATWNPFSTTLKNLRYTTKMFFNNSNLPMKLLNYFLFVGLGLQEVFLLKF